MIKSVMTNGVHPNPGDSFFVSFSSGWNVNLHPGRCVIEGRLGSNNAPKLLTANVPNPMLDRVDSVVLRLDYPQRMIYEYIKEGVAALIPVPPTLQRDSVAYEIAVANITVGRTAIGLSQSMIQDTRDDILRCGRINSLIRVDATSLFAQYDAVWREFIAAYKASTRAEFEDYLLTLNEMRTNFQIFITSLTTDFQNQHDQYEQDISDMKSQFSDHIDTYSTNIVDRYNNFSFEIDTFRNNAINGFTSWSSDFREAWDAFMTDWFENFISNLEPDAAEGIITQLYQHIQHRPFDVGGVHGIRYVPGALLVETDAGWIVVARPKVGWTWEYRDSLNRSWDYKDQLALTWEQSDNLIETEAQCNA
jgi:hypothetical protein